MSLQMGNQLFAVLGYNAGGIFCKKIAYRTIGSPNTVRDHSKSVFIIFQSEN